MLVQLVDLVQRVPKSAELDVRRALKSTQKLKRALAEECLLVLRTPEEARDGYPGAKVKVQVLPGCPESGTRIEFPQEVEILVHIHGFQAALEATQKGTESLRELRQYLASHPHGNPYLRLADGHHRLLESKDIELIHQWVSKLLERLEEHDHLKHIKTNHWVHDDILGHYIYGSRSKYYHQSMGNYRYIDETERTGSATIKLYWAVIAIYSALIGCRSEALAIKVLTHEYAHAYTHLGADSDGNRWNTDDFDRLDPKLKEGLAQYYTDRVLNRFSREYPESVMAFNKLLEYQPDEYREHLSWKNRNILPEKIRDAIKLMRKDGEHLLVDFIRNTKRLESK